MFTKHAFFLTLSFHCAYHAKKLDTHRNYLANRNSGPAGRPKDFHMMCFFHVTLEYKTYEPFSALEGLWYTI